MADLQNKDEALNLLFRAIPSVNDLLLLPAWQRLLETHPAPL